MDAPAAVKESNRCSLATRAKGKDILKGRRMELAPPK